jgi:hypothetical protein
MTKRLNHFLQTVDLLPASEGVSTGAGIPFRDPCEAGRFVRGFSGDPRTRTSLRARLAQTAPGEDISLLDEPSVDDQLARCLFTGALFSGAAAPAASLVFGEPVAAPEVSGGGVAAPETITPKSANWIAIELVGEDDKPIPGEKYRIQLPDGTFKVGRLDAQGRARLEGVTAGSCEVCFADLDSRAWEKIG